MWIGGIQHAKDFPIVASKHEQVLLTVTAWCVQTRQDILIQQKIQIAVTMLMTGIKYH